jgi:hypothetical protein
MSGHPKAKRCYNVKFLEKGGPRQIVNLLAYAFSGSNPLLPMFLK